MVRWPAILAATAAALHLSLYLEGLIFGIIPVFFVGPVIFTLLGASLRGGFRAGALCAVGIAVSDVCAIALCALGLAPILTRPWGQWGLELAGAIILIGFGAVMMRGRPVTIDAAADGDRGDAGGLSLFARGFLVNFVNPFVFTFWIGAIGGLSERHGYSAATLVWFFAGVMTMILGTDLLKARLAGALRRRLGGRAGVWAPRLSGLALALFGAYLLARAATDVPG